MLREACQRRGVSLLICKVFWKLESFKNMFIEFLGQKISF
jgi:hypothetical protein